MKKNKRVIFNGAFLLIVFVLTIYGVFHGEDLGAMMDAIQSADKRWLVPGLALVAFFIWGESIIIWYMMRSYGIKLKKRTCFLFSSVGFFFSCITPSASGGQPMQAYYMKKKNISIPVSAVILMIITITYKLVLVVVGIGVAVFGRGFLHQYLEGILPVFYLGLGLNIFCVTFYDDSGVSSIACQISSCMGTFDSREIPYSASQRRKAEKTGRVHGYLQRYSCLSEDTSESDRECHCDHICTENGNVCSNMVCI